MAWAYNVAEQNKVKVNWDTITEAAIVQGCDLQRANHSDWHADLFAPDLTKYLETSAEPRWWTTAAIRATVEALLDSGAASLDVDGTFNVVIR